MKQEQGESRQVGGDAKFRLAGYRQLGEASVGKSRQALASMHADVSFSCSVCNAVIGQVRVKTEHAL